MIDSFRKNERLLIFLKFLGWLFVFLVMLEVIIRIFFIRIPALQFVEGLGYMPADNSVSVWGVEGYGVTRYMKNGEITTPWDSGVSVVVLGDSYTEGLQVNDDQKYVSIAENILHENGQEINLHNLGYSGQSMADYVYMAPFVQKTYSPEIIVLQVSSTDFIESMGVSRKNYFVSRGTSVELVHNENYYMFNVDLQNMVTSTGLGSMAKYKLTPLVKEQRLRLAKAAQAVENPADDANSDNANAPLPNPEALSFPLVEAQINQLKQAYPAVELVFLVIPDVPIMRGGQLILNEEGEDALVAMLGEFSDLHLIYPHEEFIELYSRYRKLPRGFSNTLPGVGHLNPDGNFVVGVALADYLKDVVK